MRLERHGGHMVKFRPLKGELSSSCLPREANKMLCVGEECDQVYILRKTNKQIKED
jgi:hypothetical protein